MGTIADFREKLKDSNILREIMPDESIRLKKVLCEILMDIIKVCKKYNICYMLAGGSCLGAVRHKGFIPWDDDLDLIMPREDLKKFVSVFEKELSNKYEITSPNTKKESKNNFTKIYKKGTLCLEIYDTQKFFPNGIYIDIFALDYVSDNKLFRKLKGFFSDILCFIATSVFYAQYLSIINNKNMNIKFKFRILLGKICSIISHKSWVNFADSFMQGKKSNFVTVATGRKHYYNETMKKDFYFPISKGFFEGIEVNLPNNTHEFLVTLYGKDYMKLPPIEKRERHFIIDLKFDYKE